MILNVGIFTAGLLAVSLPILIHLLLKKRRKPIPFGAIRLVQKALDQTRRSRILEQWLLLITRCLLVAAIALALGRPIVSSFLSTPDSSVVAQTLYIVLDNSLSSATTTQNQTDLARSLAAANAQLDLLKPSRGDRAALITAAGTGTPVILPPTSDLAALRAALNATTPSDAPADLHAALSLLAADISPSTNTSLSPFNPSTTTVLIASAFRAGSISPGNAALPPLPTLPPGTRVIATNPQPADPGNVALIALTPDRPLLLSNNPNAQDALSKPNLVTISAARFGAAIDTTPNLPVRVGYLNTSPSTWSQANLTFAPGQRTTNITLPAPPIPFSTNQATPTVLQATLAPDALALDNSVSTPLLFRERLTVAIIAPADALSLATDIERLSPAQWLTLALRPLPDLPFTSRESPEQSASSNIELIRIPPTDLSASPLSAATIQALSQADALAILSADLLPLPAWQALAPIASQRKLIFITPPTDRTTHTWPDDLRAGMPAIASNLVLPRESSALAPDSPPLRAALAPLNPTTSSTTSPNPSSPPLDLLASIRPELESLLRPLAIFQDLPPTPPAAPTTTIASSSDPTSATQPTSTTQSPAIVPITVRAKPFLSIYPPSPSSTSQPPSTSILVYLSVPLDLRWSDLPAKPLFVPLMQEIFRQGVGKAAGPITAQAGSTITLPQSAALLKPLSSSTTNTPTLSPSRTTTPLHQGLFTILDPTARPIGTLAINPATVASDTSITPPSALLSTLSSLLPSNAPSTLRLLDDASNPPASTDPTTTPANTSANNAENATTSRWIIIALVLAIIELLLARHASLPLQAPKLTKSPSANSNTGTNIA